MKEKLVIAISAVSGGGKTTVIQSLNNQLTSSKALYFDDYDFEECPDDFFEWVQSSCDYNLWNTDILVKDINYLLNQSNLEYILLDYPFAYKNDKVAPYIDYTIFIDTPLDIAMARRILRDKINESVDLLENDLINYLSKGRVAYLEMIKTIKPNSDFIIDGTLELDDIVTEIIKKIKIINEEH
ncbi:hypothetical protein ACQPVP_00775 [Clostridium nigeriense]|uniref:hypothetical protein n=1 Tax=Clostridium nigeriense TaxID=1805470 RepID=UPI003D34DA79